MVGTALAAAATFTLSAANRSTLSRTEAAGRSLRTPLGATWHAAMRARRVARHFRGHELDRLAGGKRMSTLRPKHARQRSRQNQAPENASHDRDPAQRKSFIRHPMVAFLPLHRPPSLEA